MGLSCSCNEYDGDGWFWTCDEKFSTFKANRRRRCVSCKELISVGSECVEFPRYRGPQTDIEERIYGEGGEIEIATWYMCEKCGEHYLNLSALGYCINLGSDNMLDLLKGYQEMTGFKPEVIMKKFDIWLEGWAATGGSGTARLIGKQINGETFESAVVAFSKTPAAEGLGSFDQNRMTFWGCRVFDNEQDARKSFG